MKLIIQNAIAAHVEELRKCPELAVEGVIEKMADSISVRLASMKMEAATAGIELVSQPAPAPVLMLGLQPILLKSALKGLADANTIPDAHRIFVAQLNRHLQGVDAAAQLVVAEG